MASYQEPLAYTAHADSKRTRTLPVPASTQQQAQQGQQAELVVLGPQPSSAPPVPSSQSSPPTDKALPPARRKASIMPTISAGPLIAEIERLIAACEEHDRKIRTSRSSIEHKLFTEMPEVLSRLNGMDDQAENITAQMQSTISTLTPILDEKLASIVKARQADVETMKMRTTPWMSMADEAQEEAGPRGRIKRVTGAGVGVGDKLQRIERWADEVDMYITSEIVRIREQLDKKQRKRVLIQCGIALLIIVMAGVTYRITMHGRRLHVPESIRAKMRPLLRSVFD